MLRSTLLGLSLCCLPVMADSIAFYGYSQYPDIGSNVSASGVDSLHFSKTAPVPGAPTVPIAGVGTDVDISQRNGAYLINGSLFAYQGFPSDSSMRGSTGASVFVVLDLPSATGDFTVAGTDTEFNNDDFGTGIPSCDISVEGGTASGPCNSPTFVLAVNHTPGTPISLDFRFANLVATAASTYQESFNISVSGEGLSAAPEPGTFGLLAWPLGYLVFAWRKRLCRLLAWG